jgi:DnaJ-class molecular chaperone
VSVCLSDGNCAKRIQVLSDPQKRKIYDQVGEDGLKGGVPPGGASGFQGQGFQGFSGFSPSNPEEIFAQVCLITLGETCT